MKPAAIILSLLASALPAFGAEPLIAPRDSTPSFDVFNQQGSNIYTASFSVGVWITKPYQVFHAIREPVVTKTADGWEITFKKPGEKSAPVATSGPRKYSVQEVDALRTIIGFRLEYGTAYDVEVKERADAEWNALLKDWRKKNPGKPDPWAIDTGVSGRFVQSKSETVRIIEDLIHSAMLAGFTAEDIRAEDKRKYEQQQAEIEAIKARAATTIPTQPATSTSVSK